MARVVSFVPERSEGANDATRDSNKLYAWQVMWLYHYYQYTRPNRTNLFHSERLLTWNHIAGCKCKFHWQPLGPRKGAFKREQFVIWPHVVIFCWFSYWFHYFHIPIIHLVYPPPPKVLHKHCFQFLLGYFTIFPRELENNIYAKFWGVNKVYYG